MKGLLVCFTACLLVFATKAKSNPRYEINDSLRFIKLQLVKDAVQKDETVIIFKNRSNPAYDSAEDSRYLQGNGAVRIYSYVTPTDPMVFNTQPFPTKSSTTRLHIFTRTSGSYKLKLSEIDGVPPLFNIWLFDDFLKDSIDLRQNRLYNFNVAKTDSNTFGGNRFKIVIKRDNARAGHLLNVKVEKLKGKKFNIAWTTENENNNTVYTVERGDKKGKNFVVVDSLVSNSKGVYSLVDKAPAKGLNTYRLKQRDFTDSISYSANLAADAEEGEAAVVNTNNAPTVYPNPVIKTVNVAISNKLPAGTYSIAITNIWGLKVKQGNTNTPQWQTEVGDLKPGMYMVTVTSNTDNKVVGYNKFLKN